MKGFLSEPFFDRIFAFSTNSATMLDLDQKRRLAEIFFEVVYKSPLRHNLKFRAMFFDGLLWNTCKIL